MDQKVLLVSTSVTEDELRMNMLVFWQTFDVGAII